MSRFRAARDDDGAFLVLYALLGVALFTMAAIVLDIAALRQGRRADRAAADLSATAGAAVLDAADPSTYAPACRSAWDYAVANRSGAGDDLTVPDCSAAFGPAPCDAATPARTVEGRIGRLTVRITHPVPDGSDLMQAEVQGGDVPQGVHPATDGTACQRLGVEIERFQPLLFGGIVGLSEGTTEVHSVARAAASISSSDVAGVVALDRTGCETLSSSSEGGQLSVGSPGTPGVLAVDSDASACGAGYVIAPGDPGRIEARASGGTSGAILSFALTGSGSARAYDPAAVVAGRLSPAPAPALRRVGRGFVDLRYNCTSGCPPGSDHVNQLRAALGGSGVPVGYVPYLGPCTVTPADPPLVLLPNSYVPCPVFDVAGTVSALGSVVFEGEVRVQDGACLAVNDGECGAVGLVPGDVTVVLRSGGLSKAAKGRLSLSRTFALLPGPVIVPADTDPGGGSQLTWTAPLSGPFEDLLLWTEASVPMRIGGQASEQLEGTLFAPNAAPFVLQTRSTTTSTLAAQVIAARVRLEGPAGMSLRPTAARATGLPIRQVRLVR